MCDVTKHKIITRRGEPTQRRSYSVPYHWRAEVGEEIQKMLRLGIIRNSSSDWCSGLVPIRKSDGGLRLCVDYRPLNAITVKDKYPLPNIGEILDGLSNAIVYSILDGTSGYHQFEIAEEDRKKTAFRFNGGFYEFVRMPFGLCNAPSTFQRSMDIIFQGIIGDFVVPYLDDIIVFSKSIDEHGSHLREVLRRLNSHNITLNESKCKFYREEIKILGRIVSKGKVRPDPEKIKAINEFKVPKTIRHLRSFLGLVNFCREFIPGLSGIGTPLFRILDGQNKKSEQGIQLNEAELASFYAIRRSISEETERYQPKFAKNFIVTTDASNVAIGGILSQLDSDNKERIVHTFSRSLVAAERNYSATDKELLAVVKTLEYFRKYLLGRKFTLKTDHRALTYLWKTENLEGRLMRWSLKLQEFNFDVEYIKDELNAADGLSRFTKQCSTGECVNNEARVEHPNAESLLAKYHEISGHGSANTMKFLLRDRINKSIEAKQIEDFVNRCKRCAEAGRVGVNSKNRVIESQEPDDMWFIDLIGRIPDNNGGNKFILVCIDHFTKWVYARVLKRKSKEEIMRVLEDIFRQNKIFPKKLISDNGREFKNNMVQDLAKKNHIEWCFNAPYHHKSNGVVERVNQTLWNKIRRISGFGDRSWERAVKKATFATNICFNRAINTSPYIARFGKPPNLNKENVMKDAPDAGKNTLDEVQEQIREFKTRYYKEIPGGSIRKKRDLNIDTKVLIYNQPPRNPLDRSWKVGYKIKKLIGKDSYEVTNGEKSLVLNKIHVKRDTTV